MENRDRHSAFAVVKSPTMNWTIIIIAVAVLGGFYLLKRMSFVSEEGSEEQA